MLPLAWAGSVDPAYLPAFIANLGKSGCINAGVSTTMQALSTSAWFTVVGGIISIIAFVFSAWIWQRAEIKERELIASMQSIYDISGSILWEMQSLAAEDDAARVRQAERAIGLTSAIHTLSSKYVKASRNLHETELGMMVDRGIIIPNSMLWNIESSSDTKEVWLATPDLEPDLSDRSTGNLVARNLRDGKRYVYFYPSSLQDSEDLKTRLLANVGTLNSVKMAARVTFVPVNIDLQDVLFRRGNNNILFFQGKPGEVSPHVFEEVLLNKISQRGVLWQQHEASVAQNLARILWSELQDALRARP
jgi:hypothetical protein